VCILPAVISPACQPGHCAGIGYVPQGRGLFAGMTVVENVALGRLARPTDGKEGVVWPEQ
jgi:ABC-type branched-subunit amino acid transport system ATPase component